MAEVFEKPKKFTKPWFSYIWGYYKVHFACVLFALVLVVITVVDVVTKVNYDLNINYVATNAMYPETEETIEEAFSNCVEDVNEDKETHVSVTQINFIPEAMQDSGQFMALDGKLTGTLASKDEMLYIFDEMMLRDVLSMEQTEGIFLEADEWCVEKINKDLFYEFSGGFFAVSLKNSALFKERGIDASSLYLAVRMNYQPGNEELEKKHASGIKLANAIIKE